MNIKTLYNTFVLATMSGLMIGCGSIVYLMCPNKSVGAALFSFGLLTIICQGFALYTGRVGYFRSYGAVSLLTTIAGNFVGTFLVAKAFQATRHTVDIAAVVGPKLQDSSLSIFLLSELTLTASTRSHLHSRQARLRRPTSFLWADSPRALILTRTSG